MKLRPCTYPTCPNLVPRGRCSIHANKSAPTAPTILSPSARIALHHRNKPFYNSTAWKKARLTHLSLYPVCMECNIQLANQVDHIQSIEERPDLALDPENLRSICQSCHSRKTVKQDGGFGNPRTGG